MASLSNFSWRNRKDVQLDPKTMEDKKAKRPVSELLSEELSL